MTSWRSARAIRLAAGLACVRFHDGRHTAITTLAEKGLPDWVIQAQVGHVAPEMMKTYSHIRRQALNEAAAALEPTGPQPAPRPPAVPDSDRDGSTTSHSTSQDDVSVGACCDLLGRLALGSAGRIRAENDEPQASWSKPRDCVRLPPRWTISATGWCARRRDGDDRGRHPLQLNRGTRPVGFCRRST